MKRLLPLLIGAILLLPGSALARPANPVPSLATLAVSPAVTRTLERVGTGIDSAWEGESLFTFFESMLPEWWAVATTNLMRIDPQWTAVKRGLQDTSACQRMDLFLLEEAELAVQEQMKAALDAHEVLAILRLTELSRYLDQRYGALANLGGDPLGQDYEWGEPRLFDPADYEDNGEPVCYFTTDYLPPVITNAGYGCDAGMLQTVIDRLGSLPDPAHGEKLKSATELERRGVQSMQDSLRQSVVPAEDLLAVQQEIEALQGNPSSAQTSAPSLPNPDAPHESASGCQDTLPQGVWLRALTGPFSIEKNNLENLVAFRANRRQEGTTRPLPYFLRSANPDQEAPFTTSLRVRGSADIEDFSRDQGQKEAETFGTSIDPALTMQKTLLSFRLSVGRLATLATDIDGGVRGFVRDFAYYLRRSCLGRACQNRLDTTLKVIYADKCFPFTNEDHEVDPDHPNDTQGMRCLRQAGLDELIDAPRVDF